MTAMRADARRNREALLRSAITLFTQEGAEVPLEAVARHAGVGIGTLYRHFPNREALVAEAYRNEIAQLGQVRPLLDGRTGAEAMSDWVARFVEYSHTKRALADVLRAIPPGPAGTGREVLIDALDTILAAGARDGTLRTDMDAEDVLSALSGLWTRPAGPDWSDRAEKLGRFVVDGLRR